MVLYFLYAVLAAAVWIGCGVLSYGYYLGDHNHNYPYFKPRSMGFFISGGIAGLLATHLVYGFKHSSFKKPTREEAWAAHQKEFSCLGKENFDELYDK